MRGLRSIVKKVRVQVRRQVQKTSSQLIKTIDNTNNILSQLTTSNSNRLALLHAVRFAHNVWRQQAKLQNININAAIATGKAGCLDGPDLDPLICQAPTAIAMLGPAKELRDAVAEGVADCFEAWQDAATVPGLPWYPAFVAFPGPTAPPMPNVPFPIISLASEKMTQITIPAQLKQAILRALPPALKTNEVDDFLEVLSLSLSTYFSRWLATQQVMLVMGKGPVPTFAPPYVPVGPVVGGDIISSPGHLSSGALPMIV